MRRCSNEVFENIPVGIQEAVHSLLDCDPRRRPTSQNLAMTSQGNDINNLLNFLQINYFADPGVQALQHLDVIQMKDATNKMTFYHSLKNVLSNIPKKMWFQHILPSMEAELQSSEVLAAALQPILYMIEELSVEEYHTYILPIIKNICCSPKSVQCSALQAVSQLIDDLDPETIRKTILPKAKHVLDNNVDVHIDLNGNLKHKDDYSFFSIFVYCNDCRKMPVVKVEKVEVIYEMFQVQGTTLNCIERVIDNLQKTEILDDVLPMLLKAKLTEPLILMPVLRIYKHMLCDKRFGLTVNLLATKVMPSLTPVVVSPNLKLDEFSTLVELLQDMLEHVARSQRNKLKLEGLSMPSTEKLHRHMDQPIGYPHRPPCLRLESRRTSISVDDVVKRIAGSRESSPDSNLLQVKANLPGRRHSDNTIQPPRILVNPSGGTGPSSGPGSRRSSVGNLNFRRHSSVNPQDPRYSNPSFIPSYKVCNLSYFCC
ncbi:SCY1-like protein 2 [Leptotrombidium deliense]|uniref:SCY1-like protein 2 n=1 Tax=Leptotrombidium deliense TaxID=299467 RepID=A0A443SKT8_9ACAR|nr:SCY1-like protein 2 [Leptotrombidium deliense]